MLIWFIAPLVFFITKNPLTGPWRLTLTLLVFIWALIEWFRLRKADNSQAIKRKLFVVVVFSLFLVGATNWFFSPFFFLLYLLAIAITLVYSARAGFGFIISFLVLFIFNVGEVDVAYDTLVLLSLLTTFPLSLYLRKEYLRLQENQKQILILEKEKQKAMDTVAKLLANTVNFTSAELREPLVNVKNYASLLLEEATNASMKENLQKIYHSIVIALRVVDNFEAKVTGRKIKGEAEKKEEYGNEEVSQG